MKLAILGGSGKLGQGFSARFARTSHECVIGSRDPAKGKTNLEAATWCEAAIIAIPYRAHRALLEPLRDALRGKLVIDATVPLDPANPIQVKTESGASATEEAATILSDSDVYAAFQTVSHRVLQNVDALHDVLVAGSPSRKAEVLELIRSINLRPIDAGPLSTAGTLERLTGLLISINKQNKVKESGIKITGL
jgi:8-hydroxy-5-deazaflavin:NADPH oxidoreductase